MINYLSDAQARADLAEIAKPKIYFLDGYNTFFGGSANDFITGQAITATTTTANAAQGASVISLSSVANLLAGVVVVIKEGTLNQQILVIQSIAGNDITVAPTLTSALPLGSNVTPIWTNSTHLTTAGLTAWAYWFANAKNSIGNFIITGTTPKITLLGNSWISQNPSVLASAITLRIPGAIVVNAGVSGDTSTQMLARFDSDVPTDSNYVLFNEPGINDIGQSLSPSLMATNLVTLVSKIRALGAIPVFTGMVPLSDYVNQAYIRATEQTAQISDGMSFPSLSAKAAIIPVIPEVKSLGLGDGALKKVTAGVSNTGIGATALDDLTSGSNNTCVGNDAGSALTSGNNNVAVGTNALRAMSVDSNNVAVGFGSLSSATAGGHTAIGGNAGLSVSTGTAGTFVGKGAGYTNNSVTTDATTTATGQTCIGYEATTSASNGFSTAIGYRSKSRGYYSNAFGANTEASALGSAALFTDSTGAGASSTVQDTVALGTALHNIKIAGRLNVAQRTPTGTADSQGNVGDITSDDGYIYAKTSVGWKRAALSAF